MKRLRACLSVLLFGVAAQAQEYRLRVMSPTRQLLREQRFEEALEGLEQAAAQAQDAEDQAYYLGEAIAIARHRLQDPERALALALRIRDPAHSKDRQMALLAADNRWEAMLERFGDTDLAAWPDTCRQQAFLTRARAWLQRKDVDRAEQDLIQAIAAPGHFSIRGRACQMLGSLTQTERKDPNQALVYYEQALALTDASYAWRNESFLSRVMILLDQGRFDEAEQAFDAIQFRGLPSDHWRSRFYHAYATVLQRQGKFGSAATQLTHALRLSGLSDGARQQIQTRIDRLVDDLWEQQTATPE